MVHPPYGSPTIWFTHHIISILTNFVSKDNQGHGKKKKTVNAVVLCDKMQNVTTVTAAMLFTLCIVCPVMLWVIWKMELL